MDSQFDPSAENFEAPAPAADAGSKAEPAASTVKSEPETEAPDESQPSRSALPQLQLEPWQGHPGGGFSAAKPKVPSTVSRLRAAAIGASALAIGLGAIAAYQHDRQEALSAHRDDSLAVTLDGLKSRLDTMETARAKDETADLRKLSSDIKTSASATRDLGSTLTQLAARMDRIEKDQGARFDKLAERIDHDSGAKFGDLAARLDKIEKKTSSAPVVAAVAPPSPPAPLPKLAAPPAKPDPGVSYETTGSIERTKPVLRSYLVRGVRDGFALVDGEDGMLSVSPGDFLPGAGRVQKIERRGHGWAVLTTNGVILSDVSPY